MKQSSRCCRLAALSQLTGVQSVTLAWLWLAPMRDPGDGGGLLVRTTTSVRPKKKPRKAHRALTPLREWRAKEVVFLCQAMPGDAN